MPHETMRDRTRRRYIVRPLSERIASFIAQGDAGQVALMLLSETDAIALSDAKKREFVVRALQESLELQHDPTVIKATQRKIHDIMNGQKEKKALTHQLMQLFPDARTN